MAQRLGISASAATTIASTPAVTDGSGWIRNSGEWWPGAVAHLGRRGAADAEIDAPHAGVGGDEIGEILGAHAGARLLDQPVRAHRGRDGVAHATRGGGIVDRRRRGLGRRRSHDRQPVLRHAERERGAARDAVDAVEQLVAHRRVVGAHGQRELDMLRE